MILSERKALGWWKMNFIVGWVTNIVAVIMCCYVLRLMAPASGLKKYADVALGIVLMAVILSPICDIGLEGSFERALEGFHLSVSTLDGEEASVAAMSKGRQDVNYMALDMSAKALENVLDSRLKRFCDNMDISYDSRMSLQVDLDVDRGTAYVSVSNVNVEGRRYEKEIREALSQVSGIDTSSIYLYFNEASE